MILYPPMFWLFHLENWKKFFLKNLQRTRKERERHFNRIKLSDNSRQFKSLVVVLVAQS